MDKHKAGLAIIPSKVAGKSWFTTMFVACALHSNANAIRTSDLSAETIPQAV
jgi:hypothetical protein